MIKTINVTQKDIDKGCRGVSRRCPIARAINRVLKNEYEIAIAQSSFSIGAKIPYKLTHLNLFADKTPVSASQFIEYFDQARIIVKPFSFDIDIPKEFLKD